MKYIAILTILVLAGCSSATTSADLDNTPLNINQLCLFSCVVEAEQERVQSDNGSNSEGGDLESSGETSGQLDANL